MPSPGEDFQAWSKVAADNGNSDPLIEWREHQQRKTVNDSARSMMAAHAKNRDLTNGSTITTGSANAQQFLSGCTYTSMPTRLLVKLKIGAGLTNTGPATLNMDGLGNFAIKTKNFSDVLGGELVENQYRDFLWDGTYWVFLGYGDVLVTGTPTADQVATFTNTETVKGSSQIKNIDFLNCTANTPVPGSANNSIATTGFANDLLFGGQGIVLSIQNFKSPGTFQYTPSDAMRSCIVEVVGGGGGGGFGANDQPNFYSQGGGGGSGGYSRKFLTRDQIGAGPISVVVGAGGPAGSGAAFANSGGNSSFGSFCTALGGWGGYANQSNLVGAGGPGGAPGVGDLACAGAPGEAGSYDILVAGVTARDAGSGAGGSSIFGGGAVAALSGPGSGPVQGNNAQNFGSGGGGGGCGILGGVGYGGAGSGGIVVVTEFSGTGAKGDTGPAGPQGPTGPQGPQGPSGPGTGNVSNSGTPTNGQIAQWTDATHIQGIAASSLTTGLAPLASPVFSGDPKCPTPSPGDNDTSIATTAFVAAAIAAAGGITGFSTGDAKLTLKITADAGWVIMDDGTIGDGSSGASTRANADCQNLFTLLWNNISDTWAPVIGGRGASANADWVAHKKIQLTRQLGRALGVAGAGLGLTARQLGGYDGNETHTQTVAEMPQHLHPITLGGGYLFSGGNVGDINANGPNPLPINSGTSTDYAGSSNPMNIMNPRAYWNVMIKL